VSHITYEGNKGGMGNGASQGPAEKPAEMRALRGCCASPVGANSASARLRWRRTVARLCKRWRPTRSPILVKMAA